MKESLKTIGILAIITLVVGLVSINLLDVTHSAEMQENVDCKVVVNGYQQYSSQGNLLSTQQLWHPGMVKEGVLQILNNYGRVDINNVGVDLKSINNESVKSEFLQYFKLTVEKVKFVVGSITTTSTIIDSKTLGELQGTGVNLNNTITTFQGDSTYLRYKVEMDQDAPNSLMNIEAQIAFSVNISGYKEEGGDDDDDDKKHWAHNCIETLLKHKVIHGYPDGSIRPDQHITRAEAAVLVSNALGLKPNGSIDYKYKDASEAWFSGHVNSSTEFGVIEGYPDNTFRPDSFITREEMTAILIRGFKKDFKDDFVLDFIDSDRISNWAVKYVKSAVFNKVIEGYPDNSFKPQNYITRGEAFTIVCKLKGWHKMH